MSEAAGTGQGADGAAGYLSHRQVMIVLPGLILTMVLAMLDQLVVSTALPTILGSAVLPASIVVFVLALFIKQVPLRGRAPSEKAAPAPEAEALIG